MMIRRVFSLIILASVSAFILLPSGVFAAGVACECFCGVPKVGARSVGAFTSVQNCSDHCSEQGVTMVACAEDPSQFPDNHPNCFKEDECARAEGRFDKAQPALCTPGEHYCYSIGTPTQLSVRIPTDANPEGVGSVVDFGGYIQIVYRFLLGFTVSLAIVMVMIGGLQYAMAGASGDVKKAKARISNAVIGFILLVFCTAILATVNPQLTSLQVPQLPMVKPIEFVQGNSCEYLQGFGGPNNEDYAPPVFPRLSPNLETGGYVVANGTDGPNGPEVCGSIGEVLKDPQGNDVLSGTTCAYEYCSDPNARCVGVGKDAKCLTCLEVYPKAIPGLVPSSSICSALSRPSSGEGDAPGYPKCFYTQDPSVIMQTSTYGLAIAAGAIEIGTGGAATLIVAGLTGYAAEDEIEGMAYGTCAEIEIDCTQIQSCSDYEDKVKGRTHYSENQLDDLWTTGSLASPVNLKTVCSEDPCGAARKKGYERCQYFPDGINNCLGVGGTADAPPTSTEPDIDRPSLGRDR